MKRLLAIVFVTATLSAATRPPAVPLVTHDPYFSIWSTADHLTDANTRHWTGTQQALTGLVRVDGTVYRVMGADPRAVPALPQTALELTPTRTIYRFHGAGVELALTFLTPALPRDLDVLSRPLTYLVWDARSSDRQAHSVQLYFDAGPDTVVNTPDEGAQWSRCRLGEHTVLRMGSRAQPVLEKAGDNLRIDWGYLYLAADSDRSAQFAAADKSAARQAFQANGTLPERDELRDHHPPNSFSPALAVALDLGSVSAPVSRYLMLAYDDLFSIEYFSRKLRPYWRRNGAEAADLLQWGWRDYESLKERSAAFDAELTADLRTAGGDGYADIAILAYRQTLAAHKIAADLDGAPLMFPKENFSNGCISTVDVLYPSAPFFLLLSPAMLKAQLTPVLDYSSMARWKFPFAPHDLGTYPKANGQVYGGREETEENQMPVEESGNMLILLDALAHAEGNANYAAKYWPELTRWAGYLKQNGLDPANQLCTDDFAGHLARNANLSVKAIVALRAYADLAKMSGKREEAAEYNALATRYASEWRKLSAAGDHSDLAFGSPDTWSQKYNMVWDRLLGYHLFPPEVARQEMAYYRTRLNNYGLPLDNRKGYTKLDWEIWTATMGTQEDFEAIVAPIARWIDATPTRVPLTDWYWTEDGKQAGFQARSVVGGVYIKMLQDPKLWRKWAGPGSSGR